LYIVVPAGLTEVFTLDPMTGVLTIRAQGQGLEPAGLEDGLLIVS